MLGAFPHVAGGPIMLRRQILLALAGCWLLTWPAAAAERPNFIVILVDDLGWADVGCYASSLQQTPHIDQLAKDGIRFTNGYSAAPICSPTRAALLTGQDPARLHLTDWLPGRKDMPSQKLARPIIHQQLPFEATTLAEALKSAGYTTAAIGKWHLGGAGFSPEQQGFDVNIGGTQAGSPPGGYFNFKTPTLELKPGEYLTDRLTDEAERFITAHRDKPFFLYLPHYTVHIPLQARKELIAKYEAKARPGEPRQNPVYAAMMESLDDGVGRIVQKLKELKLTEKTVVVFTSDNGGLSVKEGPFTPATSNEPLRAGKGHLYEGGIRVPWIVSWPGTIKPGQVSDEPIISQDLFPTFCALAGVKSKPVDGLSLPFVPGPRDVKREALCWHYPHYSNQGGKPSSAVRQGDWKLIEFLEDQHVELYNLNDDPGEKTDLAAQQPERAKALKGRLHAWRTSVNAQMPTPNPDFQGK
jgi:arylsulfatase A-like enzyme